MSWPVARVAGRSEIIVINIAVVRVISVNLIGAVVRMCVDTRVGPQVFLSLSFGIPVRNFDWVFIEVV